MIILMGTTGSGKSLQGSLFADNNGFMWLSVGELLRILVTGKRRREMLQGKLLSDEELINIMDKIFDLINLKEELVLDGFPRTTTQAKWLLKQTEENRLQIEAVFNLVILPDTAHQRLQARNRIDDSAEAIDYRFKEYDSVTYPIIQLFKEQGLPVYDIDANQTPQAVHDSIWKQVKELNISQNDNKD